MGSPSELSLDYKPNGTAAYPPVIPKSPGGGSDQPAEQTQKIEDFLARLEEERQKIEAFKRELPLCMQLLNNALETYRQQLGGTYQKTNQGARPVLEEFIPLANMSINGSEKAPTAPSEKASWMVSAQLWSPSASDAAARQQQQVVLSVTAAMKEDDSCSLDTVSPKLALDCKQRNGGSGGAFLPFSKERMISKTGAAVAPLPELALAPSEKMEAEESKQCVGENGKIEARGGSNHTPAEGQTDAQSSTQRKARRCWSPDLHRRFVNALQMLGGSQVATPKQIRELMKVDGLTNDEVKSHLQKYRLHTRRPIPQPQPTAAAAAPQLVVLGGIWVPPEYAAAAAGTAIYGAHPQAHYAVPHEFYSAQPPAAHHVVPHPHLHRSIPAYKAAIQSPESDIRSGGGGGGDHRSETSIQEEDEDDDEGHGIEEDEDEEEEEVDQDEIIDSAAKVKGEEKALIPVGGNGSCSSTDVALKF